MQLRRLAFLSGLKREAPFNFESGRKFGCRHAIARR
jgi:hypothetical protein